LQGFFSIKLSIEVTLSHNEKVISSVYHQKKWSIFLSQLFRVRLAVFSNKFV
jgi:hypothetical protein